MFATIERVGSIKKIEQLKLFSGIDLWRLYAWVNGHLLFKLRFSVASVPDSGVKIFLFGQMFAHLRIPHKGVLCGGVVHVDQSTVLQ